MARIWCLKKLIFLSACFEYNPKGRAKDSSRSSTEKELFEQISKLADEKSSDVVIESSELSSEAQKDMEKIILEVVLLGLSDVVTSISK